MADSAVDGAHFSTRLAPLMRTGARGRVMVASAAAAYASLHGGGVVALVRDDADPPAVGILVPDMRDIAQVAPATTEIELTPSGIRIGGMVIPAGGWWSPERVPATTPDGDAAAALRRLRRSAPLSDFDANLLNLVSRRIDEAAARWALGDPDGTMASLHAILGLGPGSTPAGDDAIAGFLVGLRAFRHSDGQENGQGDRQHDAKDAIGARIAELAGTRTTTVSAGLLREAADGYCAASLGNAVHALGVDFTGTPAAREAALSALIAVGHTSGIATAAGLLAAVRAANSHGAATAHHHERTSWAPLM